MKGSTATALVLTLVWPARALTSFKSKGQIALAQLRTAFGSMHQSYVGQFGRFKD